MYILLHNTTQVEGKLWEDHSLYFLVRYNIAVGKALCT